MQSSKTTQRIISNRPIIRSRVQNPNPVSRSITTPRNQKYSPQVRNISSNQRIITSNQIPTISENSRYKMGRDQTQNNQIQGTPMEIQKPVGIIGSGELKKSNGLMSQLTFSQKPNKAKLVSNILMGKLDSQDYSMATTQHEMSNLEENASALLVERNMERFKNTLMEKQGKNTSHQMDQQRNLNEFQPMQSNLIKINPQNRGNSQSLQGGQRNRSTSNSSKFTKKMMTSNLLKSETKPQAIKENVLIYKTSDFTPKKANQSNKTLSTSKQRQGNQNPNTEEMDNYNFEYSYQDPVYQVYGESQVDNQYITPHFSNMQMSNPNSMVFKQNQQKRGNMQRNELQNPESDSSSMNTYMIQNMAYLEQQNYMDQHNDMVYNPVYNQEEGDYQGNQQMQNPMMYRKNWSQNKRGFKKFRPHSNNTRNLQNLAYPGSGVWGESKFNQRKFNKKRGFNQASGLSRERGWGNSKRRN